MSLAIFIFYVMPLVSTGEAKREQCKVYQVPISGKALRNHTYRTAKAGELYRCYIRCKRDPVCKSCNFKQSQEICEMNYETKETKPNDFITDEQSYYIKRTGRGGYNSKQRSASHRRKPELKLWYARTVASPRFSNYLSVLLKIYFTIYFTI